ncbi:MAG: sugar ABC transporter permease [Acidobacteriota bacterium]
MSRRSGELPHWPMHLFLLLMVVVTIYPILWVFTVAFSGQQNLAFVTLPADPTLVDRLRAIMPWPQNVSAQNFVDLFSDQPFARWLLNSVIVAAATTVVGVFLACTAGYAFSRFKFPGQRAGLMSFLVSQMFPGTLTLIPLYIIIVQWLGLGSNYLGLILVYSTTAIPFCVWMLKGYFDTIPKELEESALMDGASTTTIFFRIILPLAKPAVAVTALFSFMTAWNEFILALTFLDKEEMYTAPVGLRFFVGGFAEQQWGYFAAGSIVAAVPIVVLFMYLQKYLVSGLTAGAVKG